MKNYTVSNDVTNIEEAAFCGCPGLTSVTILNGVTSIEYGAFCDCADLQEIIVSEENANYSSLDGVLFNKDQTVLIQYPQAKSGSYIIPNSVTCIRDGAFHDCTGLTSITIPNSITEIEDWAFSFCSGLTSVTIPNNVFRIGEYAFVLCTSLTSITIPNRVTRIEESAFRGTGLTSVIIPNNVTDIGENAFRGCIGVTNITIGNSVTNIGKEAFENCKSLKEIHCQNTIPPIVEINGFWGINKTACKLYVPKNSLLKYRSASGWRDFIYIIEEDISDFFSFTLLC